MNSHSSRSPPKKTPKARPTRRALHRWMLIFGRSGANARNSLIRSRPSSFIFWRSWVGTVIPWVAAKPSAISSGLNWSSARWYTVSVSTFDEETSVLVSERDVRTVANAWSLDPTTLTGKPAPGPIRIGAAD